MGKAKNGKTIRPRHSRFDKPQKSRSLGYQALTKHKLGKHHPKNCSCNGGRILAGDDFFIRESETGEMLTVDQAIERIKKDPESEMNILKYVKGAILSDDLIAFLDRDGTCSVDESIAQRIAIERAAEEFFDNGYGRDAFVKVISLSAHVYSLMQESVDKDSKVSSIGQS